MYENILEYERILILRNTVNKLKTIYNEMNNKKIDYKM